MNNKKFIITKDEAIANKMIAHKFKLVSAAMGVYTFINDAPKNFSFDELDYKKIYFTNMLSI